MAPPAVARETLASLRHQIAKIEGRLAETLGGDDEGVLLRRAGVPAQEWFVTGVKTLDMVLGGGLPSAGLTEIHGSIMHGGGAASGFALALVALLHANGTERADAAYPVLWIAVEDALAEAGIPYAPGLVKHAGLMPRDLLISRTASVEDALWIAEEAAGLKHIRALVVELHGNPAQVDLTATRRLHRRAHVGGRPVFLVRQSAEPWPTAAPVRLLVMPAPSARRSILSVPLDGTIGHPAFTVTVSKSRAGKPLRLILEWNPDDHTFEERPTQDSRSVVSVSAVGSDLPAAAGSVVAFRADPEPLPARLQPGGEQHAPHRRAQRVS